MKPENDLNRDVKTTSGNRKVTRLAVAKIRADMTSSVSINIDVKAEPSVSVWCDADPTEVTCADGEVNVNINLDVKKIEPCKDVKHTVKSARRKRRGLADVSRTPSKQSRPRRNSGAAAAQAAHNQHNTDDTGRCSRQVSRVNRCTCTALAMLLCLLVDAQHSHVVVLQFPENNYARAHSVTDYLYFALLMHCEIIMN